MGRKYPTLFTLFFFLLLVFIISLSLGSVHIPPKEILSVLTGGEAVRASWRTILLDFRLPRAITACLAGSALSVSGLQMQTLFQNPLAGPFVLGINAGASLGVALVLLTSGAIGLSSLFSGIGDLAEIGVVTASCAGAGIILALVLAVAGRVRNNTVLLILGLMFGYAVSSMVSVLIHFSASERIHSFISWSFGSFSSATWGQIRLMAPAVIVGLLLCLRLAKPLNAMLLGELYASSMGVSIKRVRLFIIAIAALLAGSVTAFCGPIAFLGIAVPHVCRGIMGTDDHRALIPACALAGSILALMADVVAHLPGSSVILPLNAVTSLIGAPIVIWVVVKQGGGPRR